jgi:hypothetical protein
MKTATKVKTSTKTKIATATILAAGAIAAYAMISTPRTLGARGFTAECSNGDSISFRNNRYTTIVDGVTYTEDKVISCQANQVWEATAVSFCGGSGYQIVGPSSRPSRRSETRNLDQVESFSSSGRCLAITRPPNDFVYGFVE